MHHACLRVVSNEVRVRDASKPLSQGEYDGYIDWHSKDGGEPYMTAVQLVIDKNGLAKMGKPDGIPSMQLEVLRFVKSGAIVRVD